MSEVSNYLTFVRKNQNYDPLRNFIKKIHDMAFEKGIPVGSEEILWKYYEGWPESFGKQIDDYTMLSATKIFFDTHYPKVLEISYKMVENENEIMYLEINLTSPLCDIQAKPFAFSNVRIVSKLRDTIEQIIERDLEPTASSDILEARKLTFNSWSNTLLGSIFLGRVLEIPQNEETAQHFIFVLQLFFTYYSQVHKTNEIKIEKSERPGVSFRVMVIGADRTIDFNN